MGWDDVPQSCSVSGCPRFRNAAGVYCDQCDIGGGISGWSRSRDDAWLAYVDCDGIRTIPLPRGMNYEAAREMLGGAKP
ncbi:hypothetical protein QFZ61_001758 [Arthrobacter sp. B3I4]|nr:hypothetical protein [Arthrobacter sp. B3I4]